MEGLSEIPWALILPLMIISLLLTVTALIDCIRSKETNGPKPMWLLIIIFINLIGPILYFVIGRKQR